MSHTAHIIKRTEFGKTWYGWKCNCGSGVMPDLHLYSQVASPTIAAEAHVESNGGSIEKNRIRLDTRKLV